MKLNHHLPYRDLLHDKVLESFGGTKYLGEFTIFGNYEPVNVYYSEKPDVSKGHTNIFYLLKHDDQMLVGGMTLKKFEEWRYQAAVHCKKCDQVIYSKYRHDMHSCECNSVSVDGGRDYLKVSTEDGCKFVTGQLDFLNSTFKPAKK